MDERYADAVEEWLSSGYPGGRHLLHLWQDGPFWLVPVVVAESPNWQAELILNAYPPLVRQLPSHDPWGPRVLAVHAVSDFAKEVLVWHSDPQDGNLEVAAEQIQGPFDTMPGPEQVMVHFTELTTMALAGLDGDDERDLRDAAAAFTSAPAREALTALDAVEYRFDDLGAVLAALRSAAGVATRP